MPLPLLIHSVRPAIEIDARTNVPEWHVHLILLILLQNFYLHFDFIMKKQTDRQTSHWRKTSVNYGLMFE